MGVFALVNLALLVLEISAIVRKNCANMMGNCADMGETARVRENPAPAVRKFGAGRAKIRLRSR